MTDGWGYPHHGKGVASLAERPLVADDDEVARAPRSVRVLIVDDQEPYRSAARMVVEVADGFDVAGEAASGEEAIRLVDELIPDLVLMDIKMPGMDGLEATRRILADHPRIRIVALSTYEEYARLALEAGAVAFISKADFTTDKLVASWGEVC